MPKEPLNTLRNVTSVSASVSKSMRGNKASGTKPELLLSRLLGKEIRKNDLPGSPDFVFPRKRLVVFLHGCFWHRCPQCNYVLPKKNRKFWAAKFERNMDRDKLVRAELQGMGWKVMEIWEHELEKDLRQVRERILQLV